MIETGKILQQRYRIEKQIGQGGMGAVYIATDERFGSTVAIKETLCMDDSYRKAIEREARLLNSLKHIALPRVTDHFLEEEGQFLVMEYVPGEDLGFMMERDEQRFAVDQVIKWAEQLLDALDFLHNQTNPVIHRDIKPQNLKVSASGQIVLLDFGLAKGNPTDAGHQTAAKSIFGYSRNYASLEQIQGTGTDPRSDLYSLAATLYHLLTGVPPEDALTRAMCVLSQQADPLVPAHLLHPEVPKGFAGILHSALDLNASQRPQSAVEMRKMLREHSDYVHFADAATVVSVTLNADILAQQTQLMPGTTRQGVDRPTDVKTAILPEYISRETSIRTGRAGSGSGRSNRRFKVAMAALGGLLLVGSAGATAYFYNPGLFESGTSTDYQEKLSGVVVTDPTNLNIFSTDSDVENTANAVAESASGVQEIEETDVPVTTTTPLKNAKASTTAKGKPSAVSDNVKIDGETVTAGNTEIKDGSVKTPNSIIDQEGTRSIVPRVNPPETRFPPDLRNLTPQQRRRLKMMRRNNQLNFPRPN